MTAARLLAGEENGVGRNTIGAGLGGSGVYFSVQTKNLHISWQG